MKVLEGARRACLEGSGAASPRQTGAWGLSPTGHRTWSLPAETVSQADSKTEQGTTSGMGATCWDSQAPGCDAGVEGGPG